MQEVFRAGGQRERKGQCMRRFGGGADALDRQCQRDKSDAPARPVASSIEPPTKPAGGGQRDGFGRRLRVVAKAVFKIGADRQIGGRRQLGDVRPGSASRPIAPSRRPR